MRRRRKKGIAALLLALCVTLGLLPALTPTARAAGVNYLYYASEADAIAGKTTSGTATATPVTESDTAWSGTTDNPGWYVVDSTLENTNRITVTGDVRLILADGKTLTASAGISVLDGNSLTIYAQSTGDGMGALAAITSADYYAGIGSGNGTDTGNVAAGTITINGGAVTANSGYGSAGIGGGYQGAGGTITVNGGTVEANVGYQGAGIGGGYQGAGGTITVNGGAVTATGGPGGAGIGGGFSGACGAITITGGTVTANGGAGIGGGENGNNSSDGNSISITGGTVTATVPNGTKGAAIGNGGGNDATDVPVTIGAGLTVGAGTSADGAGAKVVTDVANNTSYKYAKIPFAAPAPSYTVKAADTTPDPGTGVKHRNGDEFTIAVTVSGGAFEGGEFTLTYDKDMFQLTAESVAPDKNDDKAINAATGNKFNADSDGKYAFILNNRIKFKDGDAIVTLAFKVTGKTTQEKDFDFAFDTANPPKICYDTDKDSVAATATKGSVTLTPILYAVTLTPSPSDLTLTGDNGVEGADNAKAIDGQDYVVTIGDYDANNYTYAVTLTMNNASADDKATMSGGTITIDGDDITGDFTLTVTKTLANFTVTTTADYVTGWTLVTVAKTAANNGSPVYKYAGNDMYYVEAYSAYAYLVNVEGGVTVADATANVTLGDTEAVTIAAGYDVNNTGKVDYSDALLTYRCYVKAYQTPDTAMETYLRADVNGDKKADTKDVSAIDANRTTQEAPSA